MVDDAPRFDARQAERIAAEVLGLHGVARPLPSERDQNFLIEEPGGRRRVLKIANARESRALIEAQQAAMAHIASRIRLCPRPVPTSTGAPFGEACGEDGRTHLVWCVSCLDGTPLARIRHRAPSLLESYGRSIAELRASLATFDHPAIHRQFYWDLAQGGRVVEQLRPLVTDQELALAIDSAAGHFDRVVRPSLERLPRGSIHGDLNDHNVLVTTRTSDVVEQRVTGIVDFGDMVHGYAVSDLAIAAAYVMLDSADPLTAAAHLVRAHAAVLPLGEDELRALFGLSLMRLCMSACIAAHQRSLRPDNAYLDISQAPIRRTLPALARVPFGLAEAVFRQAAGLEPARSAPRVRAWLEARTHDFAPVIGVDLRHEPCAIVDLSVTSALVSADPEDNAEPLLTARVTDALRRSGVAVGVGRFDEPRLLYSSPLFSGDDPLAERRTIHLGLDLFADAGTPVFAPVDGTVHAFADNTAPLDYGPVIVLRHITDDGTQFFTLYGHLSRDSLTGLTAGRIVRRGERIASLGTPSVNGGWTPHLHFQVITDLLEMGTDFPGVARASQRAVWRSLSPDPNLIVGIPADRFPPDGPTTAESLARRRRSFGNNLSLAYRDPLRIVRGWRQYLFDDTGRRYVDAYNNVPHVGHCHPRVVSAAQRQMALLNTNTRYLNDVVNEYAERLTATLPAPLSVCFLVNSASEANELALRLARAHTRRRDMIVLEGAYHGNTTALIELSPYKHAGPGGEGAPDWVHVAPVPDVYRGPFKAGDPDPGSRYARHVGAIVAELGDRGRGVAGFIAETCPSVGGQIVFPAGYLAEVYRHVRGAGGVCIADEVQTGLGRVGTHFWAFEAQGVVPDVVVMGKPLGNGHPIGAVVTTPEIAGSFDNGMEFFSTFGGNTVSCAIGLAVLDVLRDEGMQAHALHVGERLLAGLRPLADRHAVVGDVRGSGLFLGVELVRDRASLEPARAEASYVVNRLREMGILLGTDGPYHNVIKIRPPMPFGEDDADALVGAIDRVLSEL